MCRQKALPYKRLGLTLLLLGLMLAITTLTSPTILAQLAAPQNFQPGQVTSGAVIETAISNTPALSPTVEPGLTQQVFLPLVFRAPAAPIPSNCNPTGGSGGLAPGTYDTTVAGLKAIVVVGAGYDPAQPTFLGFNIHGDGGMYNLIQNSSNDLNQFANEHGWILVSPQSPNGSSWWSNWVGDHNQRLADVFDSMFANYNVCRDVVFGTTGSGGSEYWTGYFFPAKGGTYPAHTLVACGGNDGHDRTSRNQILALGQDPSVVARSSFYYVYGSADSLVPGIEESIALYTEAGLDVTVTKIEGAGHCNEWKSQNLPGWHERAATYWGNLAEQLSKQ